MNFTDYVTRLKASPDYRGQIAHVEEIPARPARFAETQDPLHPLLHLRLRQLGIERLYTHQAAAVDAARRGEHVLTVTATASGKTLCYNIPTVEAVLNDPRARAFYLFPTKALAQDQLGKLNDFGLFPTVRFATYDGDTPQEERRFIKRGAHIVLTNPDMLHTGILPHHTSWAAFLSHLRFVVLDEIHTYRGVFGAHVAQVIRRLRRLCALYGASPQFIACSATIANPAELMHAITDLAATLIDDNGAPSGKRSFVFWNPPLIAESGERRSAHVEATSLFTDLVRNDVRNITFTKARKSAELILKYAREAFEEIGSPLGGRVMSYRAGYTPEERRAIERGLFEGDLIGVTATNALELGVDVGGLDATVLTGYPGTIASAWQQAGRSGRTQDEALSILVALDNPLDQFLMRHPEYFFGRPCERAIVDPNNRRILGAHLACAAYEHPVSAQDMALFGPRAEGVLAQLEEEGLLAQRSGRWYFAARDYYPAADVNIRSASADNYQIRDLSRGNRLFGTVEAERVYETVHPGAIYMHQGETYLVEDLNENERIAYVVPAEVNYYTEPREWTQITVLEGRDSVPLGATTARFGEVVVTTQVLGYRRKQLYSDSILALIDLDLPERVFETEAFWFTVPEALVAEIAKEGLDLAGAIHAVEHAAIGMMPLFFMCDRWDIGGVSTPNHPDTGQATIFIYDGHPGGVGIAEGTYPRLAELLTATAEMIASCPCPDGCPSCVQSPKCGSNNQPLDKRGALFLLERLLQNPQAPPMDAAGKRTKQSAKKKWQASVSAQGV
jgi:DEAD/DEAH box helicase domain-containing protein